MDACASESRVESAIEREVRLVQTIQAALEKKENVELFSCLLSKVQDILSIARALR